VLPGVAVRDNYYQGMNEFMKFMGRAASCMLAPIRVTS
jgi:hypothetical protein